MLRVLWNGLDVWLIHDYTMQGMVAYKQFFFDTGWRWIYIYTTLISGVFSLLQVAYFWMTITNSFRLWYLYFLAITKWFTLQCFIRFRFCWSYVWTPRLLFQTSPSHSETKRCTTLHKRFNLCRLAFWCVVDLYSTVFCQHLLFFVSPLLLTPALVSIFASSRCPLLQHGAVSQPLLPSFTATLL